MKRLLLLLSLLACSQAYGQSSLDDWYGDWSGAFSGNDDHGICRVTVRFSTTTQAVLNGTCISALDGYVTTVSGQIGSNGSTTFATGASAGGSQFTATIQGTTVMVGNYNNPDDGTFGTFSFSKKPSPFSVSVTGSITGTSATVQTRLAFNAPDIGKTGAVYVTARIPASGTLQLAPVSASGAASGGPSVRATQPTSTILMQLTPNGWQQVTNGQLIPYASGVLGDQLAAQTILSGTDTSTLAGAQFCLGYGTSASEMTNAKRMEIVAAIPDPNGTNTSTTGCVVATPNDIRTFLPAAGAAGGYVSYLRVINTGSVATPVTVQRFDGPSGTAGAQGQLAASLLPDGSITVSAQQVETALGGSAMAASDRPRIRISGNGNTTLETQSFLLQPGGVFNEASAAQAGTSVTVPTYIPNAAVPSGYAGYLRVINTGSSATAVTVARIDPATGVIGSSASLTSSLPAGAAIFYSAAQIETALGISPVATERPRLVVSAASSTLETQFFITQPGGAFTNISSSQSGTTVDVRTYFPAAQTGFLTYLRVVNNGSSAASVTGTLLDGTTGATGASGTLIANLPGNAAISLTSPQIEAALGTSLSAASRPRLRVSSSANLTVQSFVLQPSGAFNEFSGAQTGTSVSVRTYIPAAEAASGYASSLRIINTGNTATPVSIALVGPAGATGVAATLISSLAAGAAQTFTPSQIEAALGITITAGIRPRILVTGNGSNVLEVQSFLSQPGGAFTEVSGGQ